MSELLAAELLAAARLESQPVQRLPEPLRPGDVAAAYRIQDKVHALIAPTHFGGRIGWKIGCTTPVMQAYLGIAAPCAAGLFAGTRHESGSELPASGFRRVGVECEIAVRLGKSLGIEALRDRSLVEAAVDSVMAAIEVVDDRYADWRTTDTPTLVADDFFAAGCVLGEPVPLSSAGDLAALPGVTELNGVEAGRGVGADVLGHPLAALAWLAGSLATRGRRLEAGEIVLTGSLVETKWLKAGDRATIRIGGLGAVELAIGG